MMDTNIRELRQMLKVSASSYWDNHYTLGKPSGFKKKTLGLNRIGVIIINAIVPTLFFIGKKYQDEHKLKRAYELLEKLPSERNGVIDKWKNLGISSENAFDSQSLLELKKFYCDKKACLNCTIGHNILKNS